MQETLPARTTPKDFFLSVGMIVALYASAISLLTVAFQAINVLFPDALDYYANGNTSALRAGVSALVVGFPLYLVLSRTIYRDLASTPDKRELWIRRWLVYLTLFVAGITLAVSIIMLVNTFLEGEITRRFILKILSVALVASAIFRYYIFDLHRDMAATAPLVKRLAWIASVVILASIVGGVSIVGTPASQRLVRLDERRVSDLSSIQWQIVNYWQRKGTVPENLNAINDPLSGFNAPMDPETNAPYEYRQTGDRSFELCATFVTSEDENSINARYQSYPGALETNDSWAHAEGRQCFERTIDPELYPVDGNGPTTIPIHPSAKPVPVS